MNTSTEPTRSVVHEQRFAHAPEKLWRTLTEPALLAQWLLSNDFAPDIGRDFQFRSEPVGSWDGVIECKVLVVEPLRRLKYSWRAFGQETTVEFTLIAVEGGTLLRVEHSGFQADQKAAYQGAQYGWQRFLGNLESLLNEEVR